MTACRWRLVAVLAGSVVAVIALVAAGTGGLAGPPVGSGAAVERWYAQAGAGPAALAALRLVGLAGAGWLGAAAALQLFASLSPSRAVQHVADVVSPLVLRRLAQGAAGLSISIGLAGPPAPADPAGTAVMEVLDISGPPTTAPATTVPPPTAPATTSTGAPVPDEVVVAPGDSFWSLAVEAVSERGGPVSVDAYWRRLVAENRARLVDPANPDLLYPGQVLTLPPVTA